MSRPDTNWYPSNLYEVWQDVAHMLRATDGAQLSSGVQIDND
jgi:hypothetical protein